MHAHNRAFNNKEAMLTRIPVVCNWVPRSRHLPEVMACERAIVKTLIRLPDVQARVRSAVRELGQQ